MSEEVKIPIEDLDLNQEDEKPKKTRKPVSEETKAKRLVALQKAREARRIKLHPEDQKEPQKEEGDDEAPSEPIKTKKVARKKEQHPALDDETIERVASRVASKLKEQPPSKEQPLQPPPLPVQSKQKRKSALFD